MESILLTYSKAEEPILMAFLKNMKNITIQKLEPFEPGGDPYEPPTCAEWMQGMAESVMQINAHLRGDINLPNARDLIAELKAMERTD